jgi:hypothetical protein
MRPPFGRFSVCPLGSKNKLQRAFNAHKEAPSVMTRLMTLDPACASLFGLLPAKYFLVDKIYGLFNIHRL